MIFYKDEIVEEVRRNREELLQEYGGVNGYLKHLTDEQLRLEKEGWVFVTPEEVRAKQRASINAMPSALTQKAFAGEM
jgi:hypothetical protein